MGVLNALVFDRNPLGPFQNTVLQVSDKILLYGSVSESLSARSKSSSGLVLN